MMGERKRRLASLIEDLAVSTIHIGFFAVVNTIISGCFPLLRFPFSLEDEQPISCCHFIAIYPFLGIFSLINCPST